MGWTFASPALSHRHRVRLDHQPRQELRPCSRHQCPAAFGFQTTNPATNVVTGIANTLVYIPAGSTRPFVLSFKPSAAFAPINIAITAACANSPAAQVNSGLNTLLLSASTTPVPDIVALAATAQNDSILHITGMSGSTVTTTINANATPTFAIFATASRSVPFVPQTNRIFVEFSDASGTVRGSISVAVETQ